MLTFTLADLEAQDDRLTAQIEQLTAQRDALRITADLLQDSVGDAVPPASHTLDQPLQDLPPPVPPPQDDLPPVNTRAIDKLEDLQVDFSGSRNLLERLRRLGRAAEGNYLSLGLMAHYLARYKKPRGSLRSLKTYIRTCISRHPEHFERVSPGIYRYYDTPRPRSVWQADGYDHASDPEH